MYYNWNDIEKINTVLAQGWQIHETFYIFTGFLGGKESACNAGDPGSIPGSRRSSGVGNATHSSTLAWEIPWTEKPGRLQSMGRNKSDMTEQLTLPLFFQLTHWKRPWCWERLKAGGDGTTEDEMVGWHHQLDEHDFEQAPGVGDGQGSLVCYSPWGRKESDTIERLNWTDSWFTLLYSKN